MRKALQAEQGKSEMEQQIRKLEKDLALQERAVKEWQSKCEAVEKKENERRKNDEKKFEEELSFLKKQNQQYKQELDRIMSLPQTKKG
jgi:dynein light intermediate chain